MLFAYGFSDGFASKGGLGVVESLRFSWTKSGASLVVASNMETILDQVNMFLFFVANILIIDATRLTELLYLDPLKTFLIFKL